MNLLMFCSNPVNGGTARIFYELTVTMREIIGEQHNIIACVDADNSVEIYNKIEGLIRLPIYSQRAIFPDKYYRNDGVRRITNYLYRRCNYIATKRQNINAMKKFLLENKVDFVIIHNGGYIGDDLCNQMLTAAYLCKDQVVQRIHVLHNDMEKNALSKIRFWAYDKRISKEATEIVTVSQYTKSRIVSSSYIKRELKMIYNGINVKDVLTSDQKKEIIRTNSSKRNVLMIGNFLRNKGQKQFIEAIDILKNHNNNYDFVIIGNIYDKEYYDECIHLIRERKLEECISIYQGINNASEYIDLFDILVVPSLYDESFGLISVEAMAKGKPVVAFACGGIPEVVKDGRNGFVVEVGDTEELALKIDWLENHSVERIKMGEQCRMDYIQKFSVDRMALDYIKLLNL